MNTPPPVRDLPKHRHDQIHDLLVKTVADDSSRPRRSWVQPAALATAAAGVVAVTVGIVAVNTGNGGREVDAAAPTSSSAEPPALAGMSQAERATFITACTKSWGGPVRSSYPPAGYRIHTALKDKQGVFAIISIGIKPSQPWGELGCEQATGKSAVSGASLVDKEMARPMQTVVVDAAEGYSDPYPGEYAAGRVSPQVKRVTYTSGGRTIDAVVHDDMFVTRMLFSSAADKPGRHKWTVKAYDGHGKLLGTDTSADYDRAQNGPPSSAGHRPTKTTPHAGAKRTPKQLADALRKKREHMAEAKKRAAELRKQQHELEKKREGK